ncbi:uncharacterized protein LOC123878218 isoform X1 [Maniola jurtina]|uniref:uncharacterized protein LOC123878218 isoform X1 n=1 Tax=Maniola jurtina TaxID=191418 RepID=UPI001E68949B|nr:uncharacterized protein LOC123878218 isoform X1 [Maniola jurtina]
MQLLHDHSPIVNIKDHKISNIGNMNANIRAPSSHNIEVNEKKFSNASLFLMNPVASGDNIMLNDLNNGLKLKEEPTPQLVPCCEGKELQINEDLVRSGLSAISVKHDSVIHCMSMSSACEKMQIPPGLVKHRNSFRSLHRPDLKRVPYLRRMKPEELETLFRGYADVPHFKKNDTNNQKVTMHPDENIGARSVREKTVINLNECDGGLLHPIPETRSGAEDVPAGKRLHGARARLYTSVLAGAKTGDQLDNALANEEYDTRVPEDIIPEDEVQFNEELQIILPPRCDDTAGSSITSSDTTTI